MSEIPNNKYIFQNFENNFKNVEMFYLTLHGFQKIGYMIIYWKVFLPIC